MLRWMTAVYVESFMRNITDAMAKSGKKIDKNSIERLCMMYLWSLYI